MISARSGRIKINQLANASREYLHLVNGLFKDILSRYTKDTVRILVASAASLGCQLLALAMLVTYLRALESNELLLGLTPRTSMTLFGMVAACTILLFLTFAVLEFKSNMAILHLCRRYQVLGAHQVMSIASKLPHWFKPEGPGQISMMHLRQILSVDVNHRSRMARILMRALIPTARLILSAAGILYISVEFSLLIFVVVGIPVGGLYWVGKRIADTVTARESEPSSAFQEQADMLANSWASGEHIDHPTSGEEAPPVWSDKANSRYFTRMEAKSLGQLLLNMANTLGIIVLVLSLGFWLLWEHQDNWSLWITYLVALRFFLTSLHRVGQSVVQTSKFGRQVRRLSEFLAAASSAVASTDPLAIPCPQKVASAYQGRSFAREEDDFDDDD